MNALKRIVRLFCSAAVAAAIALLCRHVPNTHLATLCVLLLLAVLIIASRWGLWEGVVATVAGDLLLGFFFTTSQTVWRINSPQSWVVFFTLLVVGVATAYMAASATRLTREALRRNEELERLYMWSRELSLDGSEAAVARSLASLVGSFGLDAAVFYDANTHRAVSAGAEMIPLSHVEEALKKSMRYEKATSSYFASIRVAGLIVGSLAIRAGNISELTFGGITERIESSLEKAIALEKATEVEAARKGQELKSAVLDSLLHEVKTPLSVMKTAVSSLLSTDWSPAQSREFLDILHEEIDRLDASVSEVFWTAYIDAGKLAPSRDLHDIGSLVSSALREIQPELRARSVRVAMSDPSAQATFDRAMIKGVLKELLRNALKYSPEGSPLAVSVRQCEQDFTITVTDEGIGVPAEEQDRIFEKHYRGNVKARGSGLGLSIAKTIIEAHGGTIGVTSGPNRGASFHVTLPNALQKVA
jgi:two-component system, OmpR family, sensor histidine kinase KdpD